MARSEARAHESESVPGRAPRAPPADRPEPPAPRPAPALPASLVDEPRHLLRTPPPAERAHPLEAALAEVEPEVAISQHAVHGLGEVDGVVRVHAERGVAADFRKRGAAR